MRSAVVALLYHQEWLRESTVDAVLVMHVKSCETGIIPVPYQLSTVKANDDSTAHRIFQDIASAAPA